MVRLIIASKENGEEEEVFFTQEEGPAEDFVSPGLSVDMDVEVEDLLVGFPMEYTLVARKF